MDQERKKALAKARRVRHIERYDAQHGPGSFKEKQRERCRKWREANPTRVKTDNQRRMAKIIKYNKTAKRKIWYYKRRAAERGYIWELSDDAAVSLFGTACTYCGTAPGEELQGIDRKCNAEGYTVDNCTPCCSTCNYMKGTMDFGPFMTQCYRILYNHDPAQ